MEHGRELEHAPGARADERRLHPVDRRLWRLRGWVRRGRGSAVDLYQFASGRSGSVGLVLIGGTVSIATSLTVQGQRPLDLGGGSSLVDLFGTNLNCPSIQVGDSSHYGTFLGYGTIEGSLTNNGALLARGSLTVTGDYTQTSGGELFEYWGVGEVLHVNGNATLSGFLSVSISTKYPPKPGSTMTVMTFGSLSGEFKSVNTGFSVKYNTNSVVVTYQ